MPIIGSASIQIRALDKFFEKDVQKAVNKIKPTVTLKVDADTSKASKKIRDLRHRVGKSKPITIHFDANTEKAEKQLQNLFNKFSEKEFQYEVKAHTKGATTQLEELHQRFGNTKVNMTAQADTLAARAAMKWASRPRDVWFNLRIRKRSLALMEGTIDILAGLLPMDKLGRMAEYMVTNFSQLSVTSFGLAAALGAVGGAALTAGGAIAHIAGDLSQLLGLAAGAPAVLGAMAAVVAVNKMAWSGFADAVGGNAEALAKLAPEAQKAAVALRGTGEAISTPVKNAFWEQMGTSLQDMVTDVLPALKSGLSGIATVTGRITADMIGRFARIGRNGVLEEFLDNTAQGLVGLQDGVKHVTEAFLTLGRVGGAYLPEFGRYLGDLGEKFGAFIQEAEKTGQIGDWIENGAHQFQNLVSIGGSAVTIFNSLADAAARAGSAGMDELTTGMQNLASTINSEPFQSRLVTILQGARAGTQALGEGFQELTELVGDSATAIGSFLTVTGQIGGEALSGIVSMFRDTRLGGGIMTGLFSLRDALDELEPGFQNLGNIIGDLGEIAGGVIENMAPGLNIFLDTLEQVVSGLKDGILAVQPVLNEFVQAILTITQGPLVFFAEAVGNILEVFADLPQAIQYPIAAFGLFLAFRARFIRFFHAIQRAAARAFLGVNSSAAKGSAGLSAYQASLARLRGSVASTSAAIARMNAQMASSGAITGFRNNIGKTALAIGGTGARGLMTAGRGLVSFLGGPWGLAFAGAITVMSLFGEEQRKAKENVDRLAQSLDQETGAVTSATDKIVASNLNTEESFLGIQTQASAMDIGREFGIEADLLMEAAKGSSSALAEVNRIMEKAGEGNNDWAWLTGIYSDGTKLNDMLEEQAAALEKAQARITAVAEATGTSSANAAILRANYDTLADSTSSVSDKFSALKQNLDILNGGKMSAVRADREYAQAVYDSGKALDALMEKTGGSAAKLVTLGGEFKSSGGNARQFSTIMEQSSDAILKHATSVYDATLKESESVGKATQAALSSVQPQISAFTDKLQSIGLKPGQIQGILSTLGLIPKDIVAAIRLEGGAKVKTEALLLKAAIESFMRGDYEASFDLLTDDAKNKLADLAGKGKNWDEQNFEAVMGLRDESKATREEFLAAMITATETGDWTAVLDVLDKTKPKLNEAQKGLKDFENTEAVAEFKAEDLTGPAAKSARDNIEGWSAFRTLEAAKLVAEDKTTPAVNNALNTLRGFEGTEWSANAKVEDHATPIVKGFNNLKLHPKDANLTANDMVSDVLRRVNSSPLTDKHNRMTTKDLVTSVINSINAKDLNNKLSTAQVKDLATGVIQRIDAMGLSDKVSRLSVNDLASIVIDYVNSKPLTGKDTTLRAHDRASAIVNAVNSKVLGDKLSKLQTKDLVSAVLATVNSKRLNDKFSSLNTKDLVSAVLNAVNSKVLSNKNNTLTTRDLVSAVIDSINAKKLYDKSNTITTNMVTNYATTGKKPGNLNGVTVAGADGMLLGAHGVQQFADGGFAKHMNMKSFAAGHENHVAQIAKGQWPVRIWAEPETGGEAYLPLHPAKRKRSTEILRKVAEMFGLGLFKQFSHGGFQTKPQSGGTQSFADGGFSGGSATSVSTSYVMPTPGVMSSELINAIGQAIARRSGSFYALGKNIVSGVIGGVNDSTQDAGRSISTLGTTMENDFKNTLEIRSPSRKFRKLGREVGKGLAIGLKSTSKDVRDAMNALVKELKDAGPNRYPIQLVKEQRELSNQWARRVDYNYARRLANRQQRGRSMGGTSLRDYARAIETINKRLEKANDTLKERIDRRNDLANSLADSLSEEFSLSNVVWETDSDGYRPATTFRDINRHASDILSRLRKFSGMLSKLRKAGVAPALVEEVASLGSDAGMAVAEGLLEGSKADIRGLNKKFNKIQNISEDMGMKTSNYMYKAGIDSQRGYVKGLEADTRALENAADKLTRRIVRRIKRNLKIKSPSLVFKEIGQYVGEGFIEGLDTTQEKIDSRINKMVAVEPRRNSIASKFNPTTTTQVGESTNKNATSTDGFNVNVYPSASLDERKVGDAAARELLFRVKR